MREPRSANDSTEFSGSPNRSFDAVPRLPLGLPEQLFVDSCYEQDMVAVAPKALTPVGDFSVVTKVMPASADWGWEAELADRVDGRVNLLESAQRFAHHSYPIHQ